MSDRLGPMLTVDEAAKLLRIGRTKAYAMAKEWRTSGGRSGLPVVDLGDVLRVPLAALEELIEAAVSGAATLAAERSAAASGANGKTRRSSPVPASPGESRPRRRRPAGGRANGAAAAGDSQLHLFPRPTPPTP